MNKGSVKKEDWKSFKKIPKNTPKSSESVSLVNSSDALKNLHVAAMLSPRAIEEIKLFKGQKIDEYKKTLVNSLSQTVNSQYVEKVEKVKRANQDADLKRKEISLLKEKSEIKRMKQSQSLKLSNLYFTMAKKSEKIQKQKIIKEKIRKNKEHKVKERMEEHQKSLMIENIKNFYEDRILELKTHIEEQKIVEKTIKYEEKRTHSEQRKQDSLARKDRLKKYFLVN